MTNAYSVSGHFPGPFAEAPLREWARELRSRLAAPEVTLGLVFIAPRLFEHAQDILEILRLNARVPLLAGCSGSSLVCGGDEIESGPGIVLGLYWLPEASVKAFHFTQADLEACPEPDGWRQRAAMDPKDARGWLVFAEPYRMDCERWLRSWTEAWAPAPVAGGLASGDHTQQSTQIYLDGEVLSEGVVALAIGGGVELECLLSQGCTPIGETWTITRAERNFIVQIANRPAYAVLADTFSQLTPQEQEKARGNLLVGLVSNEYQEEFHRGDFLVRNLLGADPASGMLAVGAFPRAGQTIQFQRRDAQSSTEDLVALLDHTKERLGGRTVYGACLCCCNGRGTHLFHQTSHDARLIQEHLGPLGVSGFFCNGEIGPVGSRSFLHGYSASLGVFVQRAVAG